DRFTSCLFRRTVFWGRAASFFAISSAAAMSWSPGTTRLTKPSRSASAALMRSPSMRISFACFIPTRNGVMSVGGDGEIADAGELIALAYGVATDGGDHRLGHGPDLHRDLAAAGSRILVGRRRGLDVAASGECAASAGQDDRFHIVVRLGFFQRPEQAPEDRPVD